MVKNRNINIFILIFLIIFLGNFIVTNRYIWEFDGRSVLDVSLNLINNGNFSVGCVFGEESVDGKCYSRYGVFTSIALIPFVFLDKFFKTDFFIYMFNPLIIALTCAIFYFFLNKLKFDSYHSIIAILLLSFCTSFLTYSRTLFSEPLLNFLILISFYLIFFTEKKHLSGIFFGLAFLTKITAILIIPSIFFYLLATKNYKKIISEMAFLLIFILIFFIYNLLRFQNALNTGYHDIAFGGSILNGISLFLFSPGLSIFIYQPFVLFFVFGLKNFKKENALIFVSMVLFVAIFIVFHSLYSIPAGGWSWGPRFLLPTLPFFIICVLFFLKFSKNRILKLLFNFLVLFSFLIQLLSVVINYNRYFSFANKKFQNKAYEKLYWSLQDSPIPGQIKMLLKNGYDEKDVIYWKEAFEERKPFDIKNTIGPVDLFFFWSRTNLAFLSIILVLEGFLVVKLKKTIFYDK